MPLMFFDSLLFFVLLQDLFHSLFGYWILLKWDYLMLLEILVY